MNAVHALTELRTIAAAAKANTTTRTANGTDHSQTA
jgi:hypothetical protein